MSTLSAKFYGTNPALRATASADAVQAGLLSTITASIRGYFRRQSELRIERMIAENGGKLTDAIEREITRSLDRRF